MKKIVTVLGARPQFIKASVVSQAICQSAQLQEVLVHTGQHFDVNMSEVFFDELGMHKPDHALDIHGGGHGAMTGRMLEQVEKVLMIEQPDAVLVYGDTNSTLAGALAACKLHIPLAHIEAGLRSFNMSMPEEINRILTDRISHWLFTPTAAASAHLRREGVVDAQIEEVGDVMFDVALHHGSRVGASGRILAQLGLAPASYVLATVHRAENTDHEQRLLAIVDGLQAVAQRMPVVWPLHPRTRAVLHRIGRLPGLSPNVFLIDPVGYLDMVQAVAAVAPPRKWHDTIVAMLATKRVHQIEQLFNRLGTVAGFVVVAIVADTTLVKADVRHRLGQDTTGAAAQGVSHVLQHRLFGPVNAEAGNQIGLALGVLVDYWLSRRKRNVNHQTLSTDLRHLITPQLCQREFF